MSAKNVAALFYACFILYVSNFKHYKNKTLLIVKLRDRKQHIWV